ncbi:hypothetical protein [Deinococcus peraridilitoris]|uniref:Uncharacterized protein n=1 Tax=Deinococcus peraridilitoris (strain DSM 19664 / LMG 22246 / CIP 109416 / KR-200) TaxID=937777 RepID=L0A278_DEIPD|nr:hypothetical protein [Deinococcus peraridilitoris]AFZ67549.1 hypothetical protein Deipe_2053 [Deinococcus peraridilitoris DSM 19664]
MTGQAYHTDEAIEERRKARSCRQLAGLAAAMMRYQPASYAAWVQAIADVMAMNPYTKDNGVPLVDRAEKALGHAIRRGYVTQTHEGWRFTWRQE